MQEKKKHSGFRTLFKFIIGCALVVVLIGIVTNATVVIAGGSKIVEPAVAVEKGADCILVLGASVSSDGKPSGILQDRIDKAISLYHSGAAPKLIMSGDHGTESYNEVLGMKNYAISQGVPSQDIFCDHAGFSTYESMYRAKNIFGIERMIVVTQTYHLFRALYAANGLEMDAVGVASDLHTYEAQAWFDVREVPARTKDFFQVLFKTPFAYSGAPISLDQSGDVTNA